MDVKRVGDRECIHCAGCMDVCPEKAITLKAGNVSLKASEGSFGADERKKRKNAGRAAWGIALALLCFANINPPSKVAAEIAEWNDPIQGKHDKAAGELLVDAEALYETWLDYTTIDGVQGAKPELIAKVINESGETCDWLESYGFAFGPPVGFVGGKWAIFSSYVGNKQLTESYFAAAYAKYVEMGGQYMLETEATDLLFEDGRCVGVKAVKADGTEVTIRAKAVLCCSGGYGGSQELQKRFQGEAYKLYGMYTNDGKMIASAVDNGAG